MAEEENKNIEAEKTETDVKPVGETEAKKKESKPAVAKEKKKTKEEKIELEREYIIPLKKQVLKVPRYRKAKKAVRTIKEFLARHMKVEDRDIKKVKVDIYLNNEVWFRGIRKPANKIKVKAIKKGGIVYAELAEPPEVVKFAMARDKKKKESVKEIKAKASSKEDVPVDKEVKEEVAEHKIDEQEKEKATVEAGLAMQKELAKEMKHTAKPDTPRKEQLAIHKKATKK
ncbi:MAG: 50S ribosomal protein L31e [Candidatus Pacearchaeota archaeon]